MNPIKDVVIVGGGTAGLIAALYIKRTYPSFNVTVIKSDKLGIVGVGEGTTEHWKMFMEYLDLDLQEMVIETDATIKIGILFNDWSYKGSQYCHSITEGVEYSRFETLEIFNRFYLEINSNPFSTSPNFNEIYYKNNVNFPTKRFEIANQYHFDTFKLNEYLIKKCKSFNIKIKEDLVKDIIQDSQGNISYLIAEKNKKIRGDLFIDASGFKRILSSKLGSTWIDYSKYLPMNHAITLTTDLNLKNGIEPYTKCTALSSGWAWKIPTQTRYGNGYVFNDNYINADNALNEFNQHLKTNLEKSAKDIKFNVGKINKFWIKNCISIGLSSSFTEPLEAQSIGFSIIQSQKLCEFLKGWIYNKDNTSKDYNKYIDQMFNNLVDFLQLHYVTPREDTNFWKSKNFELTDFNKETYPLFSTGFYPKSNFPPNLMFGPPNFFQVYAGLRLLKKSSIESQYQNSEKHFNKEWDDLFQKFKRKLPTPFISHIDYLKLVRENYSS